MQSFRARQIDRVEEQCERLEALALLLDARPVAADALAQFFSEQLANAAAPRDVIDALLAEHVLDAIEDAASLASLAGLADQGSHPARSLVRDTSLAEKITRAQSFELEEMMERLRALVDDVIETSSEGARDAVSEALRIFKRRESLALYAMEVADERSVRETSRGIAHLAICVTRVAFEKSAEFHKRPDLFDHLCVLGMGKLGGRELNYSSDIDLILLCSDESFEDLEARDLLEQITREATSLLEETTQHGYVFRVDLRLRPEGSRGLLVPSISAMAKYYLQWGRTWERSAMLKASPIAGNLHLGESLLAQLEPFLYRKYLDFQVLDDLREMKEMVNRNAKLSSVLGANEEEGESAEAASDTSSKSSGRVSKLSALRQQRWRKSAGAGKLGKLRSRAMSRGGMTPTRHRAASQLPQSTPSEPPGEDHASDAKKDEAELWSSPGGSLGWDVKIGTGGIREIEFFVQALQLVHCGTRQALRVRNTLDALDRLLYAGLISSEDHEILGDAYDLYRRLEHRVQMQEDRQSHRLPTTRSALEALARRMGTTREALEATIQSAREGVSQIFGRLFRESAQTPEEPTLRQASALELEVVFAARDEALMGKPVLEALREAGFERPRQVAGQLQILSQKDYGPFSPRSSTRERELGKYLLNACANSPEPGQAFSFITRLITTVGDREWFFRMLADNPHATQLLVHLFGSSDYLSGLLLRDPNVVSRLLGVGETVVERSAEQMREELATRLAEIADPSHRIGRIYRFHQEETLRLALHLAGGAARIEETNRQLANLAELVLCEVMQEIWLNLRRKAPMSPGSIHDLPFCVLAMGKLGGMELGFGSDLDLVFVYKPEERIGLDHTIFAKLAQRLVRTLSTLSSDGRLYEVDTRLRPSGQQGTLVVSVEALRDYHMDGSASLWERQAMIRARPLTGTPAIRAQMGALRRAIAFLSPLPEDLEESFASMRAKMLEASSLTSRQSAADFDIKSSRGGLIDIEFMTQYLQLRARDCVDFEEEEASSPHLAGASLDRGIANQNTWRALEALAGCEQITEGYPTIDFAMLMSDYLFLRRLEALIRLDIERGQTVLPAGEAARQMLARRAGFHGEDAWSRLELALEQLRGRVQEVWMKVFPESARAL